MVDLPDFYLWLKLLPVTLATVLPTALFTGFLCWLIWGRRLAALRREEGFFGEGGGGTPIVHETTEREDFERDRDRERVQALEAELSKAREAREESLEAAREAKERLLMTRQRLKVLEEERERWEAARTEPEEEEEGEDEGDGERAAASDEIAELTEALRESEYEVSRLNTEIQLLQAIRTEFDALRNDNADLESALDELRRECSRREDSVNALRVTRLDLEDAVDVANRQKRELEEALATVRADNRRLTERLESLCDEVEADALPEPSGARTDSEAPVDVEPKAEIDELPAEIDELPTEIGQVYERPPARIDPLTMIEGISEGLEVKLNGLGIYQFEQIAAWRPDEVNAVSARLGFRDRIARDRWIEQASALLDAPGKEPSESDADDSEGDDDDDGGDESGADLGMGEDDETRGESEEDDDLSVREQSLLFFGLKAGGGDGTDTDDGENAPSAEGVVLSRTDETSELAGAESVGERGDGKGESGAASAPSGVLGPDPDDELLREDPLLGVVYRRPPSRIDDLTRIKGIARVIEERLHEMGIFRFAQIAAWTDDQVAAVSRRLSFRERIERDRWRDQCQEFHREEYETA